MDPYAELIGQNAEPSSSASRPTTRKLPDKAPRVVIENIRPQLDCGRFPIKRTPGEMVHVVADIFADGHDVLAVVLLDRLLIDEGEVRLTPDTTDKRKRDAIDTRKPEAIEPGRGTSVERNPAPRDWRERPMQPARPGIDEWTGSFEVDAVGWHEYAIVAWVDRFRTWRRDLEAKVAAKQDVSVEILEGSLLVREAASRAGRPSVSDAKWLLNRAGALTGGPRLDARLAVALDERLAALMDTYADRSIATESTPLRIWVDRERARFGAWYEMFPRSHGPSSDRSATFIEAAAHLAYVADLGFDVVYLPPIHPIGLTHRRGRYNNPIADPSDPGSPWAIGSPDGGHTAIEPSLGTLEDFEVFRDEAERLGLEVALDLAFQCSPDHPWVSEHPEWFRHRPDGTIRYAENPPKKYPDIYPLDFSNEHWRPLWSELLAVTLFWVERGVRIFRVDNPHTKPFDFWEWLIWNVQARDPGVIFLSEAFTRPAIMRRLAKGGFSQSYTYFTWRNSKTELTEYFTELTRTEVREYLRPNLFANTPDILHAYLQHGGRPAFEARLLLAATLGASYGIYSGFELCERRAVPGTEEYAESEKYQLVRWDWNRAGHIKELIARVNQIRHRHPALQFDHMLQFQATDNPEIIAYTKRAPDAASMLLTVVNLDPHHMQHGLVAAPRKAFDGDPNASYVAHDLLDDSRYEWRGEWNYVKLEPGVRQGHIFELEGAR